MSGRSRVVVVGGGVAGLSAAWHLVELWKARAAVDADAGGLDLHVVGMLVPEIGGPPHADPAVAEFLAGSGVAGKAMSRSFVGYVDTRDGTPRWPFYGPMMPWKGCVPHGYHILWEYPNLRRMLGDDGTGEALDLRPPGGASHLGAFQGLLDDPAPGGPGIAVLGLCDPADPAFVPRTPAARALFRLKDGPFFRPFWHAFRAVFGEFVADVDPLVFADLFFAHEMDVEMRLALIGATLEAIRTDPETATVTIEGRELPLYDVEYDAWAEAFVRSFALGLDKRDGGSGRLWRGALDAAAEELRPWGALFALAEGVLEADDDLLRALRAALPDAWEDTWDDVLRLWRETERVLREVPGAVLRMVTGEYPAWRSLHFRFAPDATFSSPYSFDAAQAVRSLALCYATPKAARMWSVDGQHIQRVWVRFWERLRAAAAETEGLVVLHEHEGRVEAMIEDADAVGVRWGMIHGHGGHPLRPDAGDLGMPHTPSIARAMPPPFHPRDILADAVIPAVPPNLLVPLLQGDAFEAARLALDPIADRGNETLELLLWLREPIEWSPLVAEALSVGAIGGLEGAFCMLADYRCGLWKPETFAAERPFGPDDGPFSGSLVESCGGYADVFACRTREDAYGWPHWIKEELARLLQDRRFFAAVDGRPWPHDEEGWRPRIVDGTWADERAVADVALDDWFVAARWLVFGYVRQLSQIQSVGPRAVRQLADLADLLDPRGASREELLDPPALLRNNVRYVVMRNTKARNRFYNPAVGDWPLRPVSGLPLAGATRTFPAGDWTRNGIDVMCMEAACVSGMRAARGVYARVLGAPPPDAAPRPRRVMPPGSWYAGTDPWQRAEE